MRQLLLLSFLAGISVACQRAPVELLPEETVLRVSHLRQICQGEATFMCYLVQKDKQLGTDTWELFYDEIEGFRYEEGYVYTLKIRMEKLPNPPMDGSDRRYFLVEVLSKEKVKQ